MQFATDDNFPEICELFKKNRKFFPHIRMSKIAGAIERKECIFMDGVVIIFKIHKRSVRIGNNTVSQKSDCHLNQIVSTAHDGSASRVLNQFFDYIASVPEHSGLIYLNVRTENDRAKKFYERNGMDLIYKTSWSEGKIEGDVYRKMVKGNLEMFFATV